MTFLKEAREAIKKIDKIIQEWEESWLDSRETLELLIPYVKTIITYLERIQDEVAELKKRSHD